MATNSATLVSDTAPTPAPQARASEIARDQKMVFIVGNSRSGTTMMMRIISKHPQMHSVNEIHFFEKLWSAADKTRVIDEGEAVYLAERLYSVLNDGYLAGYTPGKYQAEAKALVDTIEAQPYYSHDVFLAFVNQQAQANGKTIPCEKTPQNVFYIREILELFPSARVINMVRDPRGVLLSQKKKWMRKDNKDSYIAKHKKEVYRLKVNYHPLTISRLWVSSIGASSRMESDPRVLTVRFEDITGQPKAELKRISEFIGVPYSEEMTRVEYIGSSNEKDEAGKVGIKKNRTDTWKRPGGLNAAEIWICQQSTGKLLDRFGYQKAEVSPNPFSLLYYYLSFPVKLVLALLMNLHRMKNIGDAIKRRLLQK